ncbi:MAG: peptidylprolyl isomerase [Candidatus Solibacter sp.]
MRFSRLLFPFAAALCLWAQTPTNAPPKPKADATPVAGSTPVTPPEAAPAPSMAGPDGVTVPFEIAKPATLPPDRVLLQVGGVKLTAGQIDQILGAYPENQRVFVNGPGRQQFIDQLVRVLLLAEEGKKRKLTETETYKNQLWYSAAGILSTHTDEDIRSKVRGDEALLHAYYEVHKSESEQVKASHILIRMQGSPLNLMPGQKDLTEEEALAKVKELRQKIVDGAGFAELAREESNDQASSTKGGELGFLQRGQTMPSFEDALFALKEGELSEPVKTSYGYHLIKVTERKPIKTFEESLPELQKAVELEASRKFLADLKAKAKIVIDPDFADTSHALAGPR